MLVKEGQGSVHVFEDSSINLSNTEAYLEHVKQVLLYTPSLLKKYLLQKVIHNILL